MYHPGTNEPALEWVELYNQMAVDIDVSGWSIDGAIHFAFPSNSIVRGGDFWVVSIAPTTLIQSSGATNVVGPFTGRLGNGGDHLLLRNNSGRVVDELTYGVDGDWPVAPDGSGVSLSKIDRETASGTAANWTSSEQIGGTPGIDNFPQPGSVLPDTVLVPVDGEWKFDASGIDLGISWRSVSYDDSAWPSRAFLMNRAISTLFNTGVGADGISQAPGTPDPHYVITAAPQGATGIAATVIENHPAWLANDAVSSWIGVQNPGTSDVSPGDYFYRTTFSLDGYLLGSVMVRIQVSADDYVNDVMLNGASTGIQFTGFTSYSAPFNLAGGFTSGNNSLEFRTANGALYPMNPHGFRALLSGSGTGINTNAPLPPNLTTYYLRKFFFFSGNPGRTMLRLNPVIADGAIVYLNGVEVYRQNLPAGTVGFSTPALTNVVALDYSGLVQISTNSLAAGLNELAVEVHRASGSPNAPVFGAELVSTPLPVPPRSSWPIAFNEVWSSTNLGFWIELANTSTSTFPLTDFVIACDGSVKTQFVFSAGSQLAANGFLALSHTELGFRPAVGDRLYLMTPSRAQVIDALVVREGLRGRSPDGVGHWLLPSAATPGASNQFALHSEIVINEIMYHHQLVAATNGLPGLPSDESWIELFNRSTNAVDLTGWKLSGGVSYRFPTGKILHPGGYLVVARNAAALRSAYPSIDILGDFSGKLSHSTDRIVLEDPAGNVANSVQYFSSGHWPSYADGGGSSLELVDPDADNSKAEAWSASDESPKGNWQSYTYRAVAQTRVGPEQWNDFILGLLGLGECLIDDVSVVESPTNSPVQFIANGNFENGLTGWRVLGTHNQSRVEVDPANPANHVLHLIATGPQEHMHNHIETTYSNGRSVVNGRLYEISFRARWLAGNNLLNTRLYFDRAAKTSVLPVPVLTGTPGARNSRYTPNAGPTYGNLNHDPVVPQPNAPVTVSISVRDPHGIKGCELWWSANGGAFSHAPMSLQADGNYTGTIPGYSAGTIIQFYVRGTDLVSGTSTFPASGANSGALYMVADGQANLGLGHNFRIVLTPANRALLHAFTNVMSNDNLPCTVIYDEKRAYYDVGVRLKGSERGRYNDTRVSFHLEFQPDDLFRGVHPVMLIDRSGAGDSPGNRQQEIVVRHMLLHAGGIPGTQPDMCRVIAPYSTHTGSAILSPRHEDEFIRTAYENGGDGTEWEMELIYYPYTADSSGYKNPVPDNVFGVDLADHGDDREAYRYPFIIKNHRDADDYRPFVNLCQAFSLASGPLLESRLRQLIDVDEWLRAYAFVALCDVGDTYTFGNNHNLLLYLRPSDQKFLLFPWDMDYLSMQAVNSPLIGDQNWGRAENLPAFKRRLYANALDIIQSSFNTSYISYWLGHYAGFAPGQNYSGFLSFIPQRAAAVIREINSAGGSVPFAIQGANFITTANNLITLSGTAPVEVQHVLINGIEYPITWNSVGSWTIRVPVDLPTNVLNIATSDLHGTLLTNIGGTVTVNYTGTPPGAADTVVINEIMFNPVMPGASYLELLNTSPSMSFDLSGWRVDGLDYIFPNGSLLTNGQYLVLAKNANAFVAAYGTSVLPFDQFEGNLRSDGEILKLLAPGAGTNGVIIVDQVRYGAAAPWPNANPGTSLQLVDSAQDPSRIGNWAIGTTSEPLLPQWVRFATTGTATSSTLYIYLQSPGEIYVDDLSLVAGSIPDVGANLIANPGFESPLTGSWNLTANFIASSSSTVARHSGAASLHLVANAAGSGSGNAIYQTISPPLTIGQPYSLSFWYLQSTNGGPLTVRLSSSGVTSGSLDPAPANSASSSIATPGILNSVATNLPPFPSIWINELQPDNVTGITNRAGQRKAWIELYNPGTNVIVLTNLYLANSFTNLTAWSFPADAVINPRSFMVLFVDGQTNLSTSDELHTGFALEKGSGFLILSRLHLGAPQVLDFLDYTNLPPDHSFGSIPDGQCITRRDLFYVTAGNSNNAASAPLSVVINEWMAANTHTLTNPVSGKFSDWFELYNYGTNTADLGGYYITDSLTNKFKFQIPAGYTIPPQSFLLVWADGKETNGTPDLHIDFKLNKDGESLGLYGADGVAVDYLVYGPQSDDVSQGRFPDGGLGRFAMPNPTPRTNNVIPNTAPVLNPIGDKFVHAGQVLQFAATASDAEIPYQTLSFALDLGFPPGAAIESGTGWFTWTIPSQLIPATNFISIRVTDNGLPPLSNVRTFTVVVLPLPQLNGSLSTGNILHLAFISLPGQRYELQFKDDLSDSNWTPLSATIMGDGGLVQLDDDMTLHAQRFYRIMVLP